MKKIRVFSSILCLFIFVTFLSSCSSSTTSTVSAPTTTTSATQSTTTSTSTSTASTAFDNFNIPIYPGSVREADLEHGKANIRVYVTGVANKSNVIDYYNSELPKIGWKVGFKDSDQLVAIKSPNDVTIAVTTLLTDTSKCAINIDVEPHG